MCERVPRLLKALFERKGGQSVPSFVGGQTPSRPAVCDVGDFCKRITRYEGSCRGGTSWSHVASNAVSESGPPSLLHESAALPEGFALSTVPRFREPRGEYTLAHDSLAVMHSDNALVSCLFDDILPGLEETAPHGKGRMLSRLGVLCRPPPS